MRNKLLLMVLLFLLMGQVVAAPRRLAILFAGAVTNDLYRVLEKEGLPLQRYEAPAAAIRAARKGDALFLVADGYPQARTRVSEELLRQARKKKLKLYIEYPEALPGLNFPDKALNAQLERGVVTSTVFGPGLKPLSILGINDCYLLPVQAADPLLVLAKVVGLDKAEYGIDDVEKHPLLFKKDNMLVATTKLTNFATGRYGPREAWKQVWAYILAEMTGRQNFAFSTWPEYVKPMYGKTEPLPAGAKKQSIAKGVEWFYNARLFIHPSWQDLYLKYQADGTTPFGPPLSQSLPNGDGKLGILEGHASKIYHNGSQQYRYWVRADVQGEAGYALAAAGSYLGKKEYFPTAANLIDYIFQNSNLRAGVRNDPKSPSYGLIGWATTHPHIYYGDDNARALLGIIGASAFMQSDKWDQQVVEAILANFRTTGRNGFRGERQEDKDLQQKGWPHYRDRDITHPSPHFESWMWACYLWLYQQTGYEPLLTKTKLGIRNIMKAYPQDWQWTNGIQQERARMVLPLAWLVRVEDTPEHRAWLDTVVGKLLENQVESGAIREELGGEGKGMFGRTKTNKEYGLHEAPLIFENGDPIADMLYTSNFGYFSLNEAAHATGNPKYKKAVEKLGNFLTRVQVQSDQYKDLDGAWFRAFEYDRWEYWASNADVGWGAWGTLAGWTQSWIVTTQVLTAQNQNFWDLTKNTTVEKQMPRTLNLMLGKQQK